MNFLITGGAGYIGSHIALMLLNNGHRVTVVDNFSNSNSSVINKLESHTNSEITLHEVDICNQEDLKKIFQTQEFEAVIHLAALKSVSESVLHPKKYFHNNVYGTSCLLASMKEFDVKKLIYSSSATVYGSPKYLPVDELHPLSCTNPYAETKLLCEENLKEITLQEDGWKIVCLRYFNPVGAHDSGIIGDDPAGTPNNLMPYIVNVASGQSPFINVFGNDYDTYDGTGVRDYVHVMDLAESHLQALNYIGIKAIEHQEIVLSKKIQTKDISIFNIGTGKGHSVLDLIKTFERVNKVSVPLRFSSRRSGDVSVCFANTDLSSEAFQWKAKRTLEEMCSSAWSYKKKLL